MFTYDLLFQVVAAMITTFGFALIFNIRGKILIHTSIAGALSWFFCLYGNYLSWDYAPTYFIATLVLAFYAEIVSRLTKTITTAILIPALIPLAPGGGIYYTVYYALDKQYITALSKGVDTMIIAGSMAIGVLTAPVIMKIFDELVYLSKKAKEKTKLIKKL